MSLDPNQGWVGHDRHGVPHRTPLHNRFHPYAMNGRYGESGRAWFNSELGAATNLGIQQQDYGEQNPINHFLYDYDWYINEFNTTGVKPALVDAEAWGLGQIPAKWVTCKEVRNVTRWGVPRATGGIKCSADP